MAAIEIPQLNIEPQATPEPRDTSLESSVRTVEDLATAAVQPFEDAGTPNDPTQRALGRILELPEQSANAASQSRNESQQSERASKPTPAKVAEPAAKIAALPGMQPKQPDLSDKFNLLWSDYLAARAGAVQPGRTDEENAATNERFNGLIWQMIKTPADSGHQVSCKLELLSEMLGVSWPDRRELALITSIRSDVERIG